MHGPLKCGGQEDESKVTRFDVLCVYGSILKRKYQGLIVHPVMKPQNTDCFCPSSGITPYPVLYRLSAHLQLKITLSGEGLYRSDYDKSLTCNRVVVSPKCPRKVLTSIAVHLVFSSQSRFSTHMESEDATR
jgi:hypothetical protein